MNRALSNVGLVLFFLLVLVGCSASSGHKVLQVSEARQGKLLLLLVVDQFPRSYLTSHRHLLKHGLLELLQEGTVFTNASHDHALTSTCPGHATIATGRHPREHGIIENHWFDRKRGKVVYCVEADSGVMSPEPMLQPTVGDLLKQTSPGSRVYAVSGKDRAAITLGGRRADGAFWYDKQRGHFTTSSYYVPPEGIVSSVKKSSNADQFFGSVWEPVLADYPAAVDNTQEDYFHLSFPYPLGKPSLGPDEEFYSSLYRSPFLDKLTFQAAVSILGEAELGMRGETDVLAVSFSALDTLGHVFGPESKEIAEVLVHIDKVIGALITRARQSVGEENLYVVFSSDHGVTPIPEGKHKGMRSRESWQDVVCAQKVGLLLEKKLGIHKPFLGHLYLTPAVQSSKSKTRQVMKVLETELTKCPHVEKVWEVRTLPEKLDDSFGRLYYNSLLPKRSPDFIVQPSKNHLDVQMQGTNHGTPYHYDRDIPLIFMGSDIEAKRDGRPARTIDIAPTVLELLGGVSGYEGEGASLR
jgi:predicted AlkP superfamily pyrophosphatase or phosphodiesterase